MSYQGAGLILLSANGTHTLLVHDARSGKWGFPKGHREAVDTSDVETAIRETFEETQISAEDYIIHNEAFKINKGSQSYIFRYAVLKDDARKCVANAGPSYEISEVQWVPLNRLFESAASLYDGNKYLRTWITDVKANVSKKSVYLLKNLLARLLPAQESVGSANVVTSA
jgi:8-oxo-dGTP pyrophosphatase MutT (NUDIX family)